MSVYNYGRAREGSGPGSPGLQGMVSGLLRGAGWLRGGRVGTVAGVDAPGVPRVLLVAADAAGEPVRVLRDVVWPNEREMTTARLSAAADDAAELAAGFGVDAGMCADSVRAIPAGVDAWGVSWELLAGVQANRAARCARMAWRLAVQASALRALAEAVAEVDSSLPQGACPVCVERQGEPGQAGLCAVCWVEVLR